MGSDPASEPDEADEELARTYLTGQLHDDEADAVRALRVTASGDVRVEAQTSIDADGRFALALAEGLEGLVVQAMSDGQAIGSALVARCGEEGETVVVPDMSAETTVEAELWLRASTEGRSNLVEIQRRVDGELAAAVVASADSDAALDQVASVLRLGEETQIRAMAEVGVLTDAEALFAAQADASSQLNAALAAGEDAEAAGRALGDEVMSSWEELGADAEARSRIEAVASMSMRLMADAAIDDPTVRAEVVRLSAEAEAEAAVEATDVVFADASDQVRQEATRDAAKLRQSINTAVEEAAMAEAYLAFEAALVGGVEDHADAAIIAEVVADAVRTRAALEVIADARLAAKALLHTELAALARTADEADVAVLAESVVSAEAGFVAACTEAADDSDLSPAEAELAASISVLASGHVGYER